MGSDRATFICHTTPAGRERPDSLKSDLKIGDRAKGSTDRGEAYWDDFVITQGYLP